MSLVEALEAALALYIEATYSTRARSLQEMVMYPHLHAPAHYPGSGAERDRWERVAKGVRTAATQGLSTFTAVPRPFPRLPPPREGIAL